VANKVGSPSIVIAGTTSESNEKKNYVKQALVYPGTPLGTDSTDVIAVLSANGNNYNIKAAEIQAAMNDKGQTAHTTVANYNYVINVTVNKTDVSLTASVTNWDNISADGKAEISFNANITSSTTDNTNITSLTDDDKFTLLRSTDGENFVDATTCTYKSGTITCSPVRYWENGNSYYFRALADYTSGKLVAETSKALTQTKDLLWGTTADHTGKEADDTKSHHYDEGDPINPRTGEVPLVFKHVMSNVVIKLKTASKDTDPDYVDLTGATVKLVKLSTSGSIEIAKGKVSASTTLTDKAFEKTIDTDYKVAELMVPQTLTSDAKMIITVADGITNGTTYSLKLSDCKLENSSTAISEWESGKQYTYTITILKEAVQFCVNVEKWKPTNGSGAATLDWD
jgi:hypothetical protein